MPDHPFPSAPKLLKVAIPHQLHRSLHSLKLLSGQSCSLIVERALAVYLARPEMEEGRRLVPVRGPSAPAAPP